MYTLNQILSLIENEANAHLQVKQFGQGDVWEINPKELDYLVLWAIEEGVVLNERTLTYNIRLLAMDRVLPGEENEQEVMSDTIQVLLDFVAYFRQLHTTDLSIQTSVSFEPFTERFDDKVSGHACVLSITQPYDYNKCQIPQTTNTIPPTVDGITLYDFCNQATLDRLTLVQIACLEAAFGLPCVDATVENSDASYTTTVASGATLVLPNITVTDSDGTTTSVPSVQDIVCTPSADATVENSDQSYSTTVASGGTLVLPNTPISANGDLVINQPSTISKDVVVRYATQGTVLTTIVGGDVVVPDVACETLTIGVYSDAGHTIPISTIPTDTTVYVRATPTNFTPDNYLFFSYDGTELIKIGEQAGADISWLTLLPLTSGYVYAVAIDSVSGDKTWAKVAFDVTGDADAAAFIAAAAITDPTQKAAIKTLVLQLKADLIWTKFHALYPFIGGSAFSHKFNLINPLDTDAAFRLVFSGGVTHNANGINGNGTNGTASTLYRPSTSATQNSASLSFYSRTNNTSNVTDMDTGNNANRFGSYVYGSNWYATINQSSAPSSVAGGSLGMFEASRVSSVQIRKRKNGVFTVAETAASNAPTSNILSLMSSGAGFYSNRNYAFFSVGTHLDDTESANFYAAVQAFQTSLGRNV